MQGRDVLREIDEAIRNSRDILHTASNEASNTTNNLMEMRHEEATCFQKFSQLRLESLGAYEEGVDALGRVDNKAQSLVEEHQNHINQLQDERDEAVTTLEKLEEDRQTQEQILREAIDRHEDASNKTQKRLENDAPYQGLANTLEEANAIVDHAASKRNVAIADRTEKGKLYEDDPLFSYLWKRKYATKDYKAGPLSTMLDRWVARLIKYRDARLNYERLLEIPERLAEHVLDVEEKASHLADEIEAYERKALENDGVDKLRDNVETQRKLLDDYDDKIVAAETRHHHLQNQVDDAEKGEKGPLKEAQDLLTTAISQKSIPDLKILAAETLTPEDDALVETLAQLRLERLTLEDDERGNKKRFKRYKKSLEGLENIRRRFKNERYDSHRSYFKNAGKISRMLNEYNTGEVNKHDLWRFLEKRHRVSSRDWQDDFGGDAWRGGFGLPGSGRGHGRGHGQRRTNWGRIGNDISREIERELGRGLGDLLDSVIINGGSYGNSRKRPRRHRRSSRTISTRRHHQRQRAPRVRLPRRSGGGGRRGGGGFKTGGGF